MTQLMLSFSLPFYCLDVLNFYSHSRDISRSQFISSILNVSLSNFHFIKRFALAEVFIRDFVATHKRSKLYLEHRKSLNTSTRAVQFSMLHTQYDLMSTLLKGTGLRSTKFVSAVVVVCSFEFFRNRDIKGYVNDEVMFMLDAWFWNRIGMLGSKESFESLDITFKVGE